MRYFASCVGVLRAPCGVWSIAALAGLSSLAGADLHFPSFGATSDLNTAGSATLLGDSIRLTGAAGYQVGSLWSVGRQRVGLGFVTDFSFTVDHTGGGLDPAGREGGDGFAFVIQNSGPGALQDNLLGKGGGLGYNGMSNVVAIEFDTWMNVRAMDPNSNHISVLTAGTGELISSEVNSLGAATEIAQLDDGLMHMARVEYSPGNLRVYLDDLQNPALSVPLFLDSTISLDNGYAYVGFTGATGGAWQTQDLHSWNLVSVPTPGAAAVLALGGLAAARRRR